MKTLFDSLKKNKSAIIVWGVTLSICLIVFLLYDISLEPFLYSAVISSVITIICIAIDFFSELKNKAEREQAKKTIPSAPVPYVITPASLFTLTAVIAGAGLSAMFKFLYTIGYNI